KYKVKYENTAIPIKIANEFVGLGGEGESFEIVNIDRVDNREKFLCRLPKEQRTNGTDSHMKQSIPSNAGNSTDRELIESAIEAITASFSRETCVFEIGLNGGYWTFGFCFGDKIIQFHEDIMHFLETKEHKPESPNYIFALGRFKGVPRTKVKLQNQASKLENDLNPEDFLIQEDIVDQLSDSGSAIQFSSQKFVQHTLGNGGICDLTQEPRTVDVVYKCDLKNTRGIQILEVQEYKTCRYQLVINVPKLCNIKEFRPNNIEDKVIDITCKSIDTESTEVANGISRDDFDSFKELTNENNLFLADSKYKINIADYHLTPCGYGFYIAQSQQASSIPAWSDKTLLVYNGEYESATDILRHAGGMFQKVLERKIFSPVFVGQNTISALSWSDSFIVWYELFDFYGNFIYYVRVLRDGGDQAKQLELQVIDPNSMIDQDGDKVEMPEFEAPNKQWNFEKFYRPSEEEK
ncbi:uncharacterized protein CANTADRAFT_29406, partial [Suhomyces tanzawaensis NRRL Y-17324]